MKDLYMKINNNNIRYWKTGKGRENIILIHGLGSTINNWELTIRYLSQKYTVYAFDLLGFGLSDKPKSGYTIKNWTDIFKKFLEKLKIRKFILIGHSLGGGIALEFTAENQKFVKKLILISSAGGGKDISYLLRILSIPYLNEMIVNPSLKNSEWNLKKILHKSNYNVITKKILKQDYKFSKMPGFKNAYLRTIENNCDLTGLKDEECEIANNSIAQIKTPTLIIWGQNDPIFPVEHGKKLNKKIMDSKLHILKKCGHMPHLEKKKEFHKVIISFCLEGKSKFWRNIFKY